MKSVAQFTFILTLFSFIAGSASAQSTRFSYSDLDFIPLTIEMEIGESDDFIPGEINGLIVTNDGTVLVNEQQQARITQFSPEGENLGLIARQGGGPGEILNTFYNLLNVGSDALLISYQQGGRRDYFQQGPDGRFEFNRSVFNNQSNQTVMFIGHRSENIFYATRTPRRNAMNLIADYQPYDWSDFVIVDEANNVLNDTGLRLKSSNQYIATTTRADGSLASVNVTDPFPYRYEDYFVPVNNDNNRFLIARADSSAFYLYESSVIDADAVQAEYSLRQKISLNVTPKLVTGEDMDFLFEDSPDSYRETAESYMEESKPPFMSLWTDGNSILLHTDTTVEGKEMVLLTIEGEPIGKFLLAEIDDVQAFRGGRVYTIHKDNSTGHSVRVYSLDQ